MKKKIVRYRIPISIIFPATHPRAGEPTYFIEKILNGLMPFCLLLPTSQKIRLNINEEILLKCNPKIHTVRANYELWAKRFEKINRGDAVLEPYIWTGKPYKSKTVTICQLGKNDGIGIQSIQMTPLGWFVDDFDSDFTTIDFANHDGLTPKDFMAWFNAKISIDMEPMAIIHLTSFRY